MNNFTPNKMMLNMLKKQMGNNPILQNVMDLAEKGQFNQIEQIARNLCSQKGIDPDTAFQNMKSRFNM